jgi:hypothetical protein
MLTQSQIYERGLFSAIRMLRESPGTIITAMACLHTVAKASNNAVRRRAQEILAAGSL